MSFDSVTYYYDLSVDPGDREREEIVARQVARTDRRETSDHSGLQPRAGPAKVKQGGVLGSENLRELSSSEVRGFLSEA